MCCLIQAKVEITPLCGWSKYTGTGPGGTRGLSTPGSSDSGLKPRDGTYLFVEASSQSLDTHETDGPS